MNIHQSIFKSGIILYSRWLKFEEKVDSANRWSKPHVSTTSLHSLNEIRRMMTDGDVVTLFDLKSTDMSDVAGTIIT